MPDTARAEPLHKDTMRVRYLIGVEVGGVRHEPGVYEADMTADEAKALVAVGRGEIVGEPLKLPVEENGAPSPLAPVEPNDQSAIGHTDQPQPEHQS